MKKLLSLSGLTVSSVLLLSCSQMRTQMNKAPSQEMDRLMETVEVDEDLFKKPKSGEYTHEMAEADADDIVIKEAVGSVNIDEELPESENDNIPYSRDFLLKKNTKRMQFWVHYFTKKNRDRFQRFINNGEEYRHHIEQVFMDYGLPKELYYVGLIESGYYLGAKSHASAVGPWQFIKGTGKRYGLKITSEFDERQDLFKATQAAAMYFRDLHNVFSSWELALSAYNAGEYGIIRRIMKHGTRDFYVLSKNKQLPSETINYVPKVLAAMHVINNAEKYGFVIPKKKNRLFDLTELKPIKKNVSLKTIAQRFNVDYTLLKKLNPELKKGHTPRHFAGTYYLRVPKSKYAYDLKDLEAPKARPLPEQTNVEEVEIAEVEEKAEKKSAKKLSYHKVKRGETLIGIAHKYNISPRALAQANNFKSWKTRVKVGQKLALNEEQSVSTRQASTPKIKVTNKPIVYKVDRGDNLTEIAKMFNLKVSKIKKANKLKRGKILVGQKLVLPDTQKAVYTVKRGDHLTKVAKEFNQPIEALIKLNSLKKRTIYPGQKLIVNMD
jgi:membrane-bound lytic murein transglycosylase D